MKNTKSKAERLDLETADITNENIAKIGALFPNCLTEAKDEKGHTVAAIDFDKLRQELSHDIVEGADERYRFDWPEKRKATILANTPTRMTLRPCREESVDFDTTQNLYIEGDNLEVLKLLRETYFGKVKMIYIDPPYNTGKDSFVYNDDFRQSVEAFAEESDTMDEDGNKMFDLRKNNESNGRFHTDWLNMMYPRLKVAKDLLTDDGVIFISIDDNEVMNLRRLCEETFGTKNILGIIVLKTATDNNGSQVTTEHEYMLCIAKRVESQAEWKRKSEAAARILVQFKKLKAKGLSNEDIQALLRKWIKDNKADLSQVAHYNNVDDKGVYSSSGNSSNPHPGGYVFDIIHPKTGKACPKPANGWRWPEKTFWSYADAGEVEWGKDETTQPHIKKRIETAMESLRSLIYEDNRGTTKELSDLFDCKKVFDNPKPHHVLSRIIDFATSSDSLIFDFFSGSASTAHAVMELNAEDGGKRKFIMVQLPEPCDEKSEAAKAGYKNVCEIGMERIRRAGKKILEEVVAKNAKAAKESAQGELELGGGHAGRVTLPDGGGLGEAALPDVGFRVLKLDTSNMEEVYYSPKVFADKVMQGTLNLDGDASLAENIKQGRTGEDLLFQSMLRLDVPLSAKIETEEIHGKRVFVVDDGYMMATFDKDVNEEAIKAIAKRTPSIFVMCDGGFATDNVADNFEQIWKAFSPDTVRRVI